MARLAGRPARWLLRRWRGVALLSAAGLGAMVLLFAGLLAWVSITLPLEPTEPPAQGALVMHDARGAPFASRGTFRGEPLARADLPPTLVQAVLAIEDRRFYSHAGIDPRGMLRAALVNLRAGGVRQGASTITQQLVKLQYLSPERSFDRKFREIAIALWLDLRLTKDEILTRYLNTVYFGAGAYGVDGAAQRYFGKSARALTLAESALLAGLIKAPSAWSPIRDPEAAVSRAAVVLDAMVATGAADPAEAAAAKAAPLQLAAVPDHSPGRRFFADWIASEVDARIGRVTTDLQVATTLDPELQDLAEATVERWMAKEGAAQGASQAALLAMRYDGAVIAMVGGRDYGQSQFNRATQARRQAGSLFKAFVYLAAFQSGLTPDSTAVDQPVAVGNWRPENYGGRYAGPMTLRTAFAQSSNSVAVQLAEQVGRKRIIQAAQDLGVASPIADLPSLALGTSDHSLLELTQAFAAIAGGARRVERYGVADIRSRERALYTHVPKPPEGPAWRRGPMLDVMTAVVREGTGRAAAYGRPIAGKTGTTQDYRDAWFIGFTADAVVGVWVGNDDNTPMKDVTGGGLPARMWRDFMLAADRAKGGGLVADTPLPVEPAPAARPAERGGGFSSFFGLFDRARVPAPRPGGQNPGMEGSGR